MQAALCSTECEPGLPPPGLPADDSRSAETIAALQAQLNEALEVSIRNTYLAILIHKLFSDYFNV